MTIDATDSTVTLQSFASSLLKATDTDGDGHVSAEEFSRFLSRLVPGLDEHLTNTLTSAVTTGSSSTSSSSASTASATGSLFRERMLGFDWSRIDSARGSIKYDAAAILQSLDPSDRTNLQKAYQQLIAQGHNATYDAVNDNILLNDEGGAGYIGWRPLDRSLGDISASSPAAWQWLGYNSDVRGPNGETT